MVITDHPRSRGGNQLLVEALQTGKGPSPLARGKLYGPTRAVAWRGTIPARAGETAFDDFDDRYLGDHPRSRGGNATSGDWSTGYTGPSPLARGKLRA